MNRGTIDTPFKPAGGGFLSFLLCCMMIFSNNFMLGQQIHTAVPENIDANHSYLFYLHGAIVQQQGANAISEHFGPYEYHKIINTFAKLGHQVISEVRPKDAEILAYSKKIASEIRQLLDQSVPPEKIIVVGASMGGYIAIETAYELKNEKIKYAVLGVCSNSAFKHFEERDQSLCGNFFSIYETSDGAGSCEKLLESAGCNSKFSELALNMGNSHGFLYKPYPEWVDPLSSWINK